MKLLTCFQTLPDLEILSESDWASGNISGLPDTSFLPRIINPCDASALELSCRFKDKSKCHTSALTIGGRENDALCRTVQALDYDLTVRLELSNNVNTAMSAETCADLINDFISKNGNYDIIATGEMSGDTNQAKVPFLLAEHLHIKCIGKVIEYTPYDEKRIIVKYICDEDIITAMVRLPCILSVSISSDVCLRIPTLRSRINAKKRNNFQIETGYAFPSHPVRFLEAESLSQSRDPVFIDGSDPEHAAREMYRYYYEWYKNELYDNN